MNAQLLALGLTILIELAVARVWFRGARHLMARLAFVAAVNLTTHPIAWAAFGQFATADHRWAMWAVVETGVVIVEALMLRLLPGTTWRAAFSLACLINIASAAVGVLWN